MASNATELNLQSQLDEIEVLQAMFCGDSEKIVITERTPFTEAKYFLSGHTQHYDSIISFHLLQEVTIIRSPTDEIKIGIKVYCSFTRDYPISAIPKVRVICDGATNSSHINFDNKLSEYINNITNGEQCMVEIIQWIQDNIHKYILINDQFSKPTKPMLESTESPRTFSRIWIYSHHIYSTVKRKNILNWAGELKLTGFSLPGKPGVICAEGNTDSVDEYYSRLKALNWKRLSCKLREDLGLINFDVERKFLKFEEISFDPHGHGDYHMDLGKFFQFLKNHGLEDKFHVLFGVKGTESKVY